MDQPRNFGHVIYLCIYLFQCYARKQNFCSDQQIKMCQHLGSFDGDSIMRVGVRVTICSGNIKGKLHLGNLLSVCIYNHHFL